ncbi:hypothetical protein J437_LFUL017911 [Ladona fulva]|uniref:PiggyBac transposable element-derived protein domain-containing protein n=1 Tax=Ladona fulva TaxID=123851 RepID=A0A8K0KJG3_LADFU|nr:hypothetical protein J437_LFUL017911 [Ladona fulva]
MYNRILNYVCESDEESIELNDSGQSNNEELDDNPTETEDETSSGTNSSIILQGIVLKPDYAMYFSKCESIAAPFFTEVFPQRNFYLLLKFLLFADNLTTSGYIWIFIIYTGTDMCFSEKYKDKSVTSCIVLDLRDSLLGKGYTLYLYNWYISPSLLDKLNVSQTDVFGTMRSNRKVSYDCKISKAEER